MAEPPRPPRFYDGSLFQYSPNQSARSSTGSSRHATRRLVFSATGTKSRETIDQFSRASVALKIFTKVRRRRNKKRERERDGRTRTRGVKGAFAFYFFLCSFFSFPSLIAYRHAGEGRVHTPRRLFSRTRFPDGRYVVRARTASLRGRRTGPQDTRKRLGVITRATDHYPDAGLQNPPEVYARRAAKINRFGYVATISTLTPPATITARHVSAR